MAIVIDPINPVAFSVFGLPIRWYALAYIGGFVTGFQMETGAEVVGLDGGAVDSRFIRTSGVFPTDYVWS